MRPAARLRLGGAALLLIVTGVWISHTAEMVRTLGPGALEPALGRPAHSYLLPVGVGMAAVAAVLALRLAWLWRHLGARLDGAAAHIRQLLAAGPRPLQVTPDREIPSGPSTSAGLVLLWLSLAAVQLAVYVVQENLEFRAAGAPMPGLGVVTGAHWAAPFIHLYVAFVLAAAALLAGRRLRRRLAAVDVVVRLLRVLVDLAARGRAHRAWSPAPGPRPRRRRLAHALWSRPPPGWSAVQLRPTSA